MTVAAESRLERSSGRARLSFKATPGGTALDTLYQQGCSKARFPRPGAGLFEAVLLNTAGGLTDGDELATDLTWGPDTRAIVTTQAAERIYRARAGAGPASIATRMRAGDNATAIWLPQASITFDGARLARRIDVDLQPSSRFFAIESLIVGRHAMGEIVTQGSISDRWCVRIDGRLVFADHFAIDDARHGNLASHLARPAVTGGATCMATGVFVTDDDAGMLERFRQCIATSGAAGGASRVNGVTVIRFTAADSLALGNTVAAVVAALRGDLGTDLPAVWRC